MLGWLIEKQIGSFERGFDYDMGYARFMAAASKKAILTFGKVSKLAELQLGVPSDVFHGVKITAALHEDCGPCVQLGVTFAQVAGVGDAVIESVLRRDWDSLPESVALGCRFAHASMTKGPELDHLRERVRSLYGDAGLVSLSLAMVATRMFPQVKVALGYGQACSKIRVGDTAIAPLRVA